jgi:hypothetical protein
MSDEAKGKRERKARKRRDRAKRQEISSEALNNKF